MPCPNVLAAAHHIAGQYRTNFTPLRETLLSTSINPLFVMPATRFLLGSLNIMETKHLNGLLENIRNLGRKWPSTRRKKLRVESHPPCLNGRLKEMIFDKCSMTLAWIQICVNRFRMIDHGKEPQWRARKCLESVTIFQNARLPIRTGQDRISKEEFESGVADMDVRVCPRRFRRGYRGGAFRCAAGGDAER